jgi:hypothetical protein
VIFSLNIIKTSHVLKRRSIKKRRERKIIERKKEKMKKKKSSKGLIKLRGSQYSERRKTLQLQKYPF